MILFLRKTETHIIVMTASANDKNCSDGTLPSVGWVVEGVEMDTQHRGEWEAVCWVWK